jgi:hypothetical protein
MVGQCFIIEIINNERSLLQTKYFVCAVAEAILHRIVGCGEGPQVLLPGLRVFRPE